MPNMRILIVDDFGAVHRECRASLPGVEVVSAHTIDEAQQAFAANPDFAIIVMDACVPGDKPTTLPLVMEFRLNFKGPMIAASSVDKYRTELMAAGCDHECIKEEISYTVRKILGICKK